MSASQGIEVSATVDTLAFDIALEDYIIYCGKTVEKELRNQCKLLIGGSRSSVGLIDITPPCDSTSIVAQKKAGERAVEIEVRRMFKSLEDLKIYSDGSKGTKAFRRLVNEGNLSQLGETLFAEGFAADSKRAIPAPTEGRHNSQRRSGKVSKHPAIYFVPRQAQKEFISRKQSLVGNLKGGWCAAASYFGVTGIPSWITRHTSGHVTGETHGDNKSFRITNGSGYSGAKVEARLMARALRERAGAMRRQIEFALNRRF
jgi:hypothetical protein